MEIYFKIIRLFQFWRINQKMSTYFSERNRNKYFAEWVHVRILSLKTGCRQGDPLSPYLFLLYAEVLAKILRKISILRNDKEMKISQYADDTQILLGGTEQSLRESLQILSKFYMLSGLKINDEKKQSDMDRCKK